MSDMDASRENDQVRKIKMKSRTEKQLKKYQYRKIIQKLELGKKNTRLKINGAFRRGSPRAFL